MYNLLMQDLCTPPLTYVKRRGSYKMLYALFLRNDLCKEKRVLSHWLKYFASNSVFDRRSDNPSKTRNIKSACRDMEVQKNNVQISLSLNSQNHLSFPLSAMMSLQKYWSIWKVWHLQINSKYYFWYEWIS